MKTGQEFSVAAVYALACVTGAGCSNHPGRLHTPSVNAERSAQRAIEQFDLNRDSLLQGEEIDACPALAYAKTSYDTDGDGSLTHDEVAAGIRRWSDARVGAALLPFRVQLDGRPLSGAEVRLVPVDFIDGRVPPAEGAADERGAGMLGMAEEYRPNNAPATPLAPPGLFRVEITHPSMEVPARFNTDSELGLDTYAASRNPAGVIWDLRSKKK